MNWLLDQIFQDVLFIQVVKDIEFCVDSIVGDIGQFCIVQVVNCSEFINYICECDLQVENFCIWEVILKDNVIMQKVN